MHNRVLALWNQQASEVMQCLLALQDVIQQGWRQVQDRVLEQLKRTVEGLLGAESPSRSSTLRANICETSLVPLFNEQGEKGLHGAEVLADAVGSARAGAGPLVARRPADVRLGVP